MNVNPWLNHSEKQGAIYQQA